MPKKLPDNFKRKRISVYLPEYYESLATNFDSKTDFIIKAITYFINQGGFREYIENKKKRGK